jgi:hypothetical protein
MLIFCIFWFTRPVASTNASLAVDAPIGVARPLFPRPDTMKVVFTRSSPHNSLSSFPQLMLVPSNIRVCKPPAAVVGEAIPPSRCKDAQGLLQGPRGAFAGLPYYSHCCAPVTHQVPPVAMGWQVRT